MILGHRDKDEARKLSLPVWSQLQIKALGVGNPGQTPAKAIIIMRNGGECGQSDHGGVGVKYGIVMVDKGKI